MARERYLLNDEEDTIHSNQIVLTEKKDIRKNWWYYHKTIVLVVIAAAVMVGSFIYSIVSKVAPDYTIGLLTAVSLPDSTVSELEEYLASYGEDVNGDGRVVVQINSYVIGDPIHNPATDPNMLQANMVRFTADTSSNECMIYLHDKTTFDYLKEASGLEGFFRYNDGTEMPEAAEDYDNAMREWEEVPALAGFRPQPLEQQETTVSSEDLQKILQRYRISLRNTSPSILKDEKVGQYYQQSEEFYQRLLNNEVVQEDSAGQESQAES